MPLCPPAYSFTFNGAVLSADPSGALHWPERRLLAVADLHLEKGSGFARRGRFLPPYDTAATLDRLAEAVRRTGAETVVCVGDSFHDAGAADRIAPDDARRIADLASGRDWVWIAGNHDPEPPAHWGGRAVAELAVGPLVFRHAALPDASGEVSGHYHPAAALRVRGRRLRLRCFADDGRHLILPAFGAYAGGLNVLDPALETVLGRRFTVHVLGRERVFGFPSSRLEPDTSVSKAFA
jgi:uncharacterized protein